MKYIILILMIIVGFSSCNEDDEIEYLFPLDYFPAYPESYWIYSDGSIIKVSPGYYKHQYYEELQSTVTSDEVYVPMIDGHYVYEYAITQNDNRIPLKILLSESNGENWPVGHWQGVELKRKVIATDTTVSLSEPIIETEQSSFENCIIVVEFLSSSGATQWLSKEIYAPKVGLIREEIQRDGTSLVLRELVQYQISQNI